MLENLKVIAGYLLKVKSNFLNLIEKVWIILLIGIVLEVILFIISQWLEDNARKACRQA